MRLVFGVPGHVGEKRIHENGEEGTPFRDENGLSVVARPKMTVDLPAGKTLPPKAALGKSVFDIVVHNPCMGETEKTGKTAPAKGVK